MTFDGEEVIVEHAPVSTARTPRQVYRGEFPKEPYPAISLAAAVLLGTAMMLFLAFFGVAAFFGKTEFLPRTIFALLTVFALAMPLVGIRALFGSHPYSTMTLTALGALFLVGGYLAEPLGGAPMATFAVGPAVLVLGVAVFAWWKWAARSRHLDWRAVDHLTDRPESDR